MDADTLLIGRQGRLGRLTLNRPKALNALDRPLFYRIAACLEAWRDDPGIETILIDSTSPRAFCAGGDLRTIRAALAADGPDAAAAIFRDGYRLVSVLAHFPKPVVSFMDGIAMGGGIGLGGHVRYRIVTERTTVAMPETAIGLTPDAGGSYILSRAPGLYGLRMALTGGRMPGAEAVAAGFADRMLPSAALPELADRLARQPAGQVVDMACPVDRPDLPRPDGLNAIYDAPGVADIMDRLAACPEPWAAEDLHALRQASPFALRVTFRAYHAARRLPDLNMVLEQEYRLIASLIRHPDFAEGVRAKIVDKDNAPRWADVGTATPTDIEACFAPRPDTLDLPIFPAS
ncbi:enoyl-CoA hydratase/isomerase family protein [Gluconacetobacter azotocaptans]|uniref:enoyl-CoA hydratase/isomerase family protein n=1 Tax=Gluconacetobacter azotocaptans TaxID=142834 RepID=UPI001958896E|nr:enoyl-CoA hydratase/isomerase family protein [Gluconacetobacter azotocaptans]MBM9401292.1 enoyl-CoA hydratase/isomerase family protein [Gluconacetobacter azotocaptans]